MFATKNTVAKQIDGWHRIAAWVLLVLIGIHVVAALVDIVVCRDGLMQRMLPSRRCFLRMFHVGKSVVSLRSGIWPAMV